LGLSWSRQLRWTMLRLRARRSPVTVTLASMRIAACAGASLVARCNARGSPVSATYGVESPIALFGSHSSTRGMVPERAWGRMGVGLEGYESMRPSACFWLIVLAEGSHAMASSAAAFTTFRLHMMREPHDPVICPDIFARTETWCSRRIWCWLQRSRPAICRCRDWLGWGKLAKACESQLTSARSALHEMSGTAASAGALEWPRSAL